MRRGRFITIEGGEGAGKSTQVRRLAATLAAVLPVEPLITREPGGSAGAEALRGLLVNGDVDRWSPMAETLILFAARDDHLRRTIRPALAEGRWVICDRFGDSTRAYQGAAGGADPAFILGLEAAVVGADTPDLTIVMDMAPEAGLARAASRGGAEARFESKGLAFHEKLREGFLTIAAAEPQRCAVVDASGSVDEVERAIAAVVAKRLNPQQLGVTL